MKAHPVPAEGPGLATQDPVAELAAVDSTRAPPCIVPYRPIWGFDRGRVSAGARTARLAWLSTWLLIAALAPLPTTAQQSPVAPHPAAPKAVHHPAPKVVSPAKKAAPAHTVAAGKVIKDAAEYNDYISALNIADAGIKAGAMEAFVAKYPASVVKLDALEQAMSAYQHAGNTAKVEEVANRILELKSDHVQALAVVTFLRRTRATQGDATALADLAEAARRGLDALAQWTKPADLSDDAFAAMRKQMTAVFNGALGFTTLQAKDYASARRYYQLAFASDPNNLQDVYQLGIADLQSEPMEVDGLWYIAKATALAKNNEAAQQRISEYGKARYKKYHGSDDGWQALVVAAAGQAAPPPDFGKQIKRAPGPAEVAVDAVRAAGVENMSFSDWEFILSQRDASPANKEAAEKVWKHIQALQKNGAARLSIPVKIVAATKDTIQAAISEDNQNNNKADLMVVLKTPPASPPSPGAQAKIIGTIVDYQMNPVVFIMRDGELGAGN
jgi:tetratricopeptide (TPR) repeat protein